MPITQLEHLQKAAHSLIQRAQKAGQDDYWEKIGDWDLNAWIPEEWVIEDDANWRVTAYPVLNGETDTARGIVLQGSDDCPYFPGLDALKAMLYNEDLALIVGSQWVVEQVDGPAILVTPHDQGEWIKDPPKLVFPDTGN